MRSDTGVEVGQVLAGLTALSAVDVAGLSDGQVRAEVLALVRAQHQLSAALAVRVGVFDQRDLSRADALRSTATWLADFGRLSKRAGLALAHQGWLLRHLPASAAGMGEGLVSVEQLGRVGELVRRVGIDTVARYDQILAALCSSVGPVQIGQACERIAALEDPDGAEPDPDEEYRRRELVFGRVGRSLYLRGRLDAEGAAIVQTAIDALMRPPAPGDDRTSPQRRADAWVDLARLALSGDRLPSVGGQRPHVALLLTPEHLFNPPTQSDDGEPPETEPDDTGPDDGEPDDAGPVGAACGGVGGEGDLLTAIGVPALPVRPWLNWVGEVGTAMARRFACDGIIWRAILDPRTGLPLDVGRRHRIVPHWMRKALWLRDRGCRWPGCDTPAEWTDARHVIPWWPDGTTTIKRIVSLCRYHHRLVHEGAWTATLDPTTGQVHITRPDGQPYELGPSQPFTTPNHQGPAPPHPAA